MWLFNPRLTVCLVCKSTQKTNHFLRIHLYLVKNMWILTLYSQPHHLIPMLFPPPRVKGLTYLFSVEARRRELRRDELDSQKIQSSWGGWDCGVAARAYGVIGLGARVAKIKQVCSVTTGGGERERDRGEREGRETEGGRGLTAELLSGPKTIGGELAPLSLCALQKNSVKKKKKKKWRKEKKGREQEREKKERQKKRQRVWV